jgi:2-polyprenyl-6-methoxyphenol hydroxylase-like FAD-dependent oxidoreductase
MVDVVIVGGRPAGATLAARLGARGHRVALLERATEPSQPSVPSSPVIYPSAMAVLDELGVPEASYAHGAARMTRFTLEFAGAFVAEMALPRMWGRDYLYGIDRARFDDVLWQHAGTRPTVTLRRGFAVTDLLRDERGRVNGVVGAARGGAEERLLARCVVGADGRFSLVARKAGARVVEEESRCVSTVYFADWEGVARPEDGSLGGYVHTTGRGLDVLLLAMPDGRTSVNTHERADRVDVRGDAQAYYAATLRAQGPVASRLAGARQVSEVRGLKRIGNGYREASGDGWALVGDAVHYKDPVDGQGMYDALLGARLLDEALTAWLSGGASWGEAMGRYGRALHAETHDMYAETVGRLRRELYEEPPPVVAKTLLRWMMTDPVWQERFLRYLGRDLAPKGWNSPGLMAGAVARGLWRDVRGAVQTRV